MKRDEKKEALKRHIYDTAIDLFCERGYIKTTLIDIANAADVSTRTLHKYYSSKDLILRQFTRENIMSIRDFASGLPDDMPLMDKTIEMMIYDFKQMFCLFDISFLMFAAREKNEEQPRFDLENLLLTQDIYYDVLAAEQASHGVEAGLNTRVASTIIVGLYRMICDQYRFLEHGPFNERNFRELLRMHIEPVWPSLYESLMTSRAGTYRAYVDLPWHAAPK